MQSKSVQGDVSNNSKLETRNSFRTQYPFLSSPTCPPELKILAADKLTAHEQYTTAHKQLFDCTSVEQQFETVKQLVESFIENRNIFKELNYYKEHGHTLGLHPVFKELQKVRELHQLSDVELYQTKERLEHNIWRIKSQLQKNDKPHLRLDREKTLQSKTKLLSQIQQILNRRSS